MSQLPLFSPTSSPGRQNLVIEAGAGTGKTTAIVREVVLLLLENPDLDPERIVLITFTEKAAGEIADRIRAAMTELHLSFDGDRPSWPSDSPDPIIGIPAEKRDAYRAACERHLQRIDRLRSQTIHAFCQSILRSFPIEANLDPDFSIVQGYELTRLYNEIYDEWLEADTRAGNDPSFDSSRKQWELLYHHFHHLDFIRRAIFALLPKRDLVADETYSLGTIEEADVYLRTAVKAIRTATPQEIAKFSDAGLAFLTHVREAPLPADPAIAAWRAFFDPVADKLEKTTLPGGGKTPLKEAVKMLRGEVGKRITDRLRQQEVSEALRAVALRFFRYLEAEKRQRAVVDFDDLLLRTLEVLDEPEVLRALRARYLHIFVDEFQDTDRVQAAIIDELARDESGRFVPGKMTIVGDPKQSIYSFRRADPECYGATVASFVEGGARTDALRKQFRSDAPLVDALNAIFRAMFAAPATGQVYRPPYQDLEPARTERTRDLDARFTFLRAAGGKGEGRFAAEAKAMVSWIESRVENGDYRRFAVLFRRMTNVEEYLRVFHQHGIPTALPPARNLFDQPAVVDLLSVLRAVAYPFDAGCKISAARSPYFALSDDEIAAHYLRPSSPDPFAESVAAIDAYERDARQLSVSALIARILDDARIEALYRIRRFGETALEQIERFRDIAIDYDRTVGGSIRQFVDEISRRKEAAEEGESPWIDDGQNAVRIMTVHGAKGLEFDTVILPDLAFQLGRDTFRAFTVDEPRSLVFSGGPRSFSSEFREAGGVKLSEIGKQREEAEDERLLYVAITRAQSEVVFVCTERPTRIGFWKTLEAIFRYGEIEPLFPSEPGRVVVADRSIVPVALELPAPLAEDEEPSRLLGNADSLLKVPLSPPPAGSEVRREGLLDSGEIARRRAGMKNRAAGVLLHRVLEMWNGSPETLAPLIETLALEQGVGAAAKTIVETRLLRIRESDAFQRILAAETIGRELPVYHAGEGRIDRLLATGDGYLVVDYKSGKPYASRLEADREQIERYCAAIGSIAGAPCRGLLWYIDLESDAVIEVPSSEFRVPGS